MFFFLRLKIDEIDEIDVIEQIEEIGFSIYLL